MPSWFIGKEKWMIFSSYGGELKMSWKNFVWCLNGVEFKIKFTLNHEENDFIVFLDGYNKEGRSVNHQGIQETFTYATIHPLAFKPSKKLIAGSNKRTYSLSPCFVQ